jgi:hypothetical protein
MQKAKIALLLILIAVLAFVLSDQALGISLGYDWLHTYRPAALAMAHGESPYSVDIYFAAPWAVLPLIPLALLPEQVSNVAVFLLGLFAFAYTAYKLNAKPAAIIIFLLSAPIVGCLIWGNIEWMPLLGLIFPAPIGLIFAIIKPQVGIGLVIYWFFILMRTQGLVATIKAFLPVTLLTLLSFLLYGFWPLRFQESLALSLGDLRYNTSLWPYGIFIGLWLLYKAIQNQKSEIAVAASPFLSPYALQYTWVAVLAGVLDAPWELLLVSIGLWIAVAIRYLGL